MKNRKQNKFSRIIISPASLVCLAIIFGFHLVAHSQSVQTATTAVDIPGSQVRKLNSTIVGQEYELHINLPGNYLRDTGKSYPLVYVLDGQWDFPLVAGIYGSQYYDGFMPAVIVVGIQWAGINPNAGSLRARDFTPTSPDGSAQYGNGPKFLSFIKNELTPFMESNYRVAKNDRTLMGSSLGGLFTLYAMFNETAFFQRYVLTSPAIGWDRQVMNTIEKNYADKKVPLPVKLFMAQGQLEGGVPQFEKFVELLKSRNYQGLDLQTRILENSGHSGTKAEGYTRGLQHVFERPDLKLSAALLDQYSGTYVVGGRDTVKFMRDGDHLTVVDPNRNRRPLQAETETDFYNKGSYLNIHFTKNAGKVDGFRLETFDNPSIPAKKIN